MSTTAQELLEQVLEKGGFVQRGKWSSGLIDAEKAKTSATADLRYRHLFNDSEGNGPIVDLVYEIPNQSNDISGTPSIYFKLFNESEPSSETLVNLRRIVWNQGRAPILWVVTPTRVLIYNSYARPDEYENERSNLLEELKQVGGQIKILSEFQKWSFDTGEFWQNRYGKRIDKQQRVDKAMLRDLLATEEILIKRLVQSNHVLPTSTYVAIAHALLGRVIFVSYLKDRGLLDSSFFQKEYHRNSFEDLLDDKAATYAFFRWLRETFNGDLFPFQEHEQALVESTHLQVVKEFLLGTDMRYYLLTGSVQRALWPYKFNIIPVELISSIYEMFAHSRDSIAAEASSVHYTRLPLVELVLGIAMRDIPYSAKVLDPACGSGIFLVEALRRLVWKREKQYGQPVQRTELHQMLRSQIFGIDLDRDAIHVTAFSLYLTLLDLDPKPQPIHELKFPPLVKQDPLSNQPPNLYVQDFCNTEYAFNQNEPFANKGFDLIVGNPPWTALNERTAPRDPDDREVGRRWSLDYCKAHKIPDKKPDQAFLIRVRDFAQSNTLIALIVCSRLFYQRQNPVWLDRLLGDITIETVINLSDLVGADVLFGDHSQSSTRLPASVIVFRVARPVVDNKVMYIMPKWYPSINKHDEIIITNEDVQHLPQELLREKPFLWKSAFRGNARDYRLLSKLEVLPPVANVLSQAGVSELAHRGITTGKGAKKDTPPSLMDKPFLVSGLKASYGIDIAELPLFKQTKIAEKSNTQFLRLPALILSRSLSKEGRPCVALVEGSSNRHHLVIDQTYYGIPSSHPFPTLVYRLNAILNSKLAFYMAFMFSSALGWDRRLIEEGDWLEVRLPDSILDNDTHAWDEVLQREAWLREYWQSNTRNLHTYSSNEAAREQALLEKAVYQLYGLSEQEILLVEDTIEYSIKPILTKKSRVASSLARATMDDLQKYARRMCVQLNGILRYGNQRLTATIVMFERQSPLLACRFTQGNIDSKEMITIAQFIDVDDVIKQLAQDLRTQVADHMYIQRNLHVYEDDGFWIIKGVQKHLWSESAALNDADSIVREHMEATVG